MPSIPTRLLGKTGLEVTVLGYGAMELRSGDDVRNVAATPQSAETILNAVLDAGINYIDTSVDYGTSEEFIGAYISNRRDEYFIASKCGCIGTSPKWPPGAVRTSSMPHRFDRKTVREGIEHSLKTLKTDYLDLLQIHVTPARSVLEEEDTIAEMLEAQREGKVRFIGASTRLPEFSEHIDMGVFEVFQVSYSGLERINEAEMARAHDAGAGIVIRSALVRGRPGEANRTGKGFELLDDPIFSEILDGMSKTEFLLRFAMSNESVDTAIVGTLNPDHLSANVAAVAKGPLPTDVYDKATTLFASVGSVPA